MRIWDGKVPGGDFMKILGILIGVAIIAGLIILMGKLSEEVPINDQFRCGDCLSGCTDGTPESCTYIKDLNEALQKMEEAKKK